MLAGKMKLRNFVLLALAVGGLCGVGVVGAAALGLLELSDSRGDLPAVGGAGSDQMVSGKVAPAPATTVIVPAAEAVAPPVVASSNAPSPNLRAWDKVVFDNQGRDLGSDKLKDVSKGQSWKVNLYQDAGHKTMNRAKVDLDRDDKWDEKYTFEDGKVTRQVAPGDDENYTETYHWSGSDWVRE